MRSVFLGAVLQPFFIGLWCAETKLLCPVASLGGTARKAIPTADFPRPVVNSGDGSNYTAGGMQFQQRSVRVQEGRVVVSVALKRRM